jgi:hypothetical protein
MKNHLLIDGKKYLSTRVASRITGYSSDYIGQLSRTKKINSKLVGRSWYVEEKSLIKYKNLGLGELSKFRSSVSREPHFSSSFGNRKYVKFASFSFAVLAVILFVTTRPQVQNVAQSLYQGANVIDSLRSLLIDFIKGGKTQTQVSVTPERVAPVSTTTIVTNKIYTNPTTYVTYKNDTSYVDSKIANLQNQLNVFKNFQSRQTDAIYNNIGTSISNLYNTNTNVTNGITDLSTFNTSDLSEGLNLYFTDSRVLSTLSSSTSTTFGGDVFATTFHGDGSLLTGLSSFSTSTTRGAFSATSSLTYDSVNGVFGISTSTLGLTTSDIAEGTRLYYSIDRFDTRLAATTSLPNITTLSNLSSLGTINSGVWNGTAIGDAYLTKSGDWTGTFDGIEGSAYLSRANHTGTQLASTISDFSTTARGLISSSATGLDYTSGTGVFSLTSGYEIPLFASSTATTTAQGNLLANGNITAAKFFGDGSALTGITSFSTTTTRNVFSATSSLTYDSVNGIFGISTSTLGLTTSDLSDFSIASRGLFSNSATGLTYNSGTGDTSLTSGYNIPLTASTTEWANKIGSQWTTNGTSVYYNGGNVGIGTTTPGAFLHSLGTTEQLRLGYDSSKYVSYTVSSAGNVTETLSTSGGQRSINWGSGNEVDFTNPASTNGGQTWYKGFSDGFAVIYPGSSFNSTMYPVVASQSGLLFANSTHAGSPTVDTGISRNSAGTLEINNGVAGTRRDLIVRNLSMGTTSTSTTLTVQGEAGKNIFSIASSTGTNLLTVTQAGNVGIGTNVPWAPLTVYGNTTGLSQFSLGLTSSNRWEIGRDNISTGDLVFFSGGAEKVRFTSGGNLGIGSTTPTAKLAITGTAGTGDIFAIAASTNARLLTVTSAGNVGIGTTTPSEKLEVNGYGKFDSGVKLLSSGSGLYPDAVLTNGSGDFVIDAGQTAKFRLLPYLNDIWFQNTNSSGNINFSGSSGGNLTGAINFQNTGQINFGPAATARMTILSGGNVGIGSTTPSSKLTVSGNTFLGGNVTATGTLALTGLSLSTTGNYLCIDTTTNQITSGTTCTLSSNRFKQNVQELNLGLDTVLALRPVTFNFKQGYGDNGTTDQLGFVAEEANLIDPRLVPHDKDGLPSGFNYQNYTAVLTKAIQEQQVQINALKNATTTTIVQQTIIASSSATSTAAELEQSTSFIATIANAVKNLISSAGELVVSTIRSTLAIFDRVEVKTAAVSQGLEMKDQATGTIYCVIIKNGEWDKRPGTCAEATTATSTTPIVTPTIPTTNPPIVISTSTIATTTPSISTSTPEIVTEIASSTPTITSTSTPEISTSTPPTENVVTPAPEPISSPEPIPTPEPTPTPEPAPVSVDNTK